MIKASLLAGVAILALGGAAMADDCSGLGCLFRGHSQPAQPQPPQPQPNAAEAAQALQANEQAAKADGDGAAGDGASKETDAPAKPRTRSVHVVTIAAAPPEVERLKGLVSALPKEKIKIVPTKVDGGEPKTDFAVTTGLAPAQPGEEKARLFTEQMHIVAGPGVTSVADLAGKVVSFGPDKSPGQAAARKAFEALNVHVQETPLDLDNAFDGLSTGDVAAVVVLAPQPIDRLKSITTPGAHLVAWPDSGTMPEGAVAATIDASAYPALAKPGETIRAMGVDAMLRINTKTARHGATKSFLKDLTQHSGALAKRGFDLLKADLEDHKARHVASAGDRS